MMLPVCRGKRVRNHCVGTGRWQRVIDSGGDPKRNYWFLLPLYLVCGTEFAIWWLLFMLLKVYLSGSPWIPL
jgi:hypothetical protein